MSSKHQQQAENLGDVISALADVWPADRENLAGAGAKFEKISKEVDQKGGQLKKLIDLAWKGLIHLYENDDYFLSVKTATMQAVNTVREYLLKDGDIPVEDFEKSLADLEKALAGESESADTVLEEKDIPENIRQANEEEISDAEYTLDDLASTIMMLDPESEDGEELRKLEGILDDLVERMDSDISTTLAEARELVRAADQDNDDDGLDRDGVQRLSMLAERAIKMEAGEEVAAMEEEHSDEPADTGQAAADSQSREQKSEPFRIPEDAEEAMMGEFVAECNDLIEMAEVALLDLEESPDDKELINTVFRAFHTIKGTSAFMGLDPISAFTHSVETLLSMVREGDLDFDAACADITLDSIDILKKMLEVVKVSGGGDPLPKPHRYDALLDVVNSVCEEGESPESALSGMDLSEPAPESTSAPAEAPANGATNGAAAAAAEAGSSRKSGKGESESSVRVNVSRLDRLIDMVGELVIAHSVVAQDKAIPKDSELQKKVNHATKILRELQDTSLTLRMVPLKATFHKMNRLVRDLARKAGKSINFSTYGDDTEIDRNMVDIISEPMVHMIRNAIDHGIESPDERRDSGKEETANIWLRASHEGGKVVIEIEDDGRGIDKKKIFDKAVSKGLVEADRNMTDKEIYNLIFLPGFSSVEQVTDLSGRGVGMDVVRRAIEELQGKVEVTSSLGEGTKITLELPFTLAITDGMLVRVGGQRFIVPTINIDMTFRAEQKALFTMLGNSEQVSFRGESVPIVRLHRLFDIPDGTEDLMKGTLMVIKNGSRRYALLVDEVLGQQQLVGKSIDMIVKTPHISGGAILGDGEVGLILETSALLN